MTLPERDARTPADWDALAQRSWQRMKWRSSKDGGSHCLNCGLPIHRTGTYYVRPAYFDGTAWLCQRCYKTMRRHLGLGRDNRYGKRRDG